MLSSIPASSGSNSSGSNSSDVQKMPNTKAVETVTVECCDRWQVYHRLQALDISCQCSGLKPLQVQITTPADALQLWSIVRRVSQPRLALAANLQRCWQLSN